MEHKKIFLVVTSVVVITSIVAFVVYKQETTQGLQTGKQTTITASVEPQKTDFGVKLPDEFPTDIPVEKGADIKQSYSLNYTGQKQLTIVFQSTKTVKENYALYADYLKKQNWTVSNKYESAKLSSLYGIKENNEINVTIGANSSSVTQVSVSILKK